MVKLKTLSMHKIDNIPDHVMQEMQDFAVKLGKAHLQLISEVHPNIAFSALNWTLTAMIKVLISEDAEELRKASKQACMMIINNMEVLIKQMEEEGKGQK